MEPTNGSAGLLATAASALRVDTSGVFLDVFGDRSEFSTFEEFSDLFVRFEKKSRYIFRVKNSSSVEAENRRRKDKIDSAIKYSGLVLCCVNCGDANKTLKKVQEGDSRQLCDAHIYLRYRSSSRKLAIISSSFVHNHASQAGNGCFHRKQSVTERIGKPRDGRRKFVKAGDKMGKLTRPILPLPLFEHRLLKNTSELTIIPLGAGLLPLTGDLPTPPPPRLLLNSGLEDRREHCHVGPMKPDKRPTLPSLQPPPGLRGPDAGLTSRGDPLSGVKAEPPVGGGPRDARRGKEEPGLVDLRRILEPECILRCYEDENAPADDNSMDDDYGDGGNGEEEEVECTATDLSVRPREGPRPPELPLPENLSAAVREYSVTWKELEPLFRFCSRCGAPVEKTRHSLHNVLSVSAVCQRGHGVFWTSRS
uniref:ZSWIM3 N-terminal domain-containing protein n=1 Tax=Ixodes ricinus TaxID=34613 RepID=A0A147BEE7_IXORI